MNPFLLDANSRIIEWRKLRIEIENLPLEDQLTKIAKWWSSCPIAVWVLDYEDSKNWPKPWELLHDNHYCNTAIAYMMAMTLYMSHEVNPPNIELWYIDNGDDEWMCMVVEGKYILNYSHGEVFDIDNNFTCTIKYRYSLQDEKFIPLN
jgi:hypothetical protein